MPPSSDPSPTPSDAPVRVLTLLKGLSRGGAESLALLGARHRDRTGLDHSLAYTSARHDDLVEEIAATGVPVTCLGGPRPWDLRWLLRLRAAMGSVDVVHSHSPVPAVGARLARLTLPRRRRPRLITTEHNVWESHHRLTRLAESLTFGLDDAHLAVSDAVRRSLPAAKAERVEVLVQGVDLDALRATADRDAVRRELGVSDHHVVVGTVANLRPQKGYLDLLRAAATVSAQAPDVRFVAVGRGPQEDEIRALHRSLDLGDRFTLLGYRADAARLLSGFDIFCMASHHEGLPVALMEALALGLPVVVTRAGGNAELVTDGREGRLVEPGRPTDLAAALLGVVTDDTARKAHAQHAADRGDTLSITTSVQRHEALYRALVRRSDG